MTTKARPQAAGGFVPEAVLFVLLFSAPLHPNASEWNPDLGAILIPIGAIRQSAAKPVSQTRRPPSFPLDGDYNLQDLLDLYGFRPQDTLPVSGLALMEFFHRFGIEPGGLTVRIDPAESLPSRFTRWKIRTDGPLSVKQPEQFRTLVLATLESYFTMNPGAVPADSTSRLSRQDQFAGALFREVWGHDIYSKSLTRPESPNLSDGSVLFETAFAPVETGNFDLIRNKTLLLSQLEMIGLDAEDGVMNGRELNLIAARLFDQAAGTRFASAAEHCTSFPAAVIDPNSLLGPLRIPLNLERVQGVADSIYTPVETFIRALVLFHAIAVGGASNAAKDAPAILGKWAAIEAHAGVGAAMPSSGDFGFVTYFFHDDAKAKIKTDAARAGTSGGLFLFGDAAAPGVAGPGGFLDQILFRNFGAACPEAF